MKQSNQEKAKKLLRPYRAKIDRLDAKLIKLLGDRFRIVEKVASIKIKHDIPAFLGGRVIEVRENAVRHAKKYGIDEVFMRTLYTMIIYQSCATEDLIKHREKTRTKKK